MATQPTTYKVQKGDTLGAISKKLGVGMDTITGYKSGDPNKIFEGETLSYGAPAAKNNADTSYVGEVKSQLTEPAESKDPYGLASIRTKIEDNTTKRDAAFNEMKNISTTTFNDEYAKRGLAEKKAKLATIDSDITAEKAKRDEALAKVRSNPGLSAAQMTGDAKKIADYQNDVINTKIAERNAVAGEYNTDLEEIDKIVSNKVKDKTLDYGYYDSVLKDLTGQVGDYTKLYREDLQNETQNSQFEKQLAQAMQIAQLNASKKGIQNPSNLQLKTDPNTGEPLYWFNPDTGAITRLDSTEAPAGGNQGVTFDSIDKSTQQPAADTTKKGSMWNPLNWFK